MGGGGSRVGGGGGGGIGYSGVSSSSVSDARGKFQSAIQQKLEPRVRNVFISFHIDDENAVNLLRHQSKDNEFGIHFRDYSVKEPFDSAWKTRCKERISQTSATFVMIGPETHRREAVEWEIRESLRQGKKVIGVRIYKDKNDPIPRGLRENNCRVVTWKLARMSKVLDED